MGNTEGRFSAHTLVYCGFFIAVGVILPSIFHLIGGPASGGMFLPMHLPVLIAGLLLGPVAGGACGLVTPFLSFLATQMPSAAKLPFMTIELVTYAVVAGFLFQKKKYNLYLSLILAQVAGRLVNALCLWIAGGLLSIEVAPAASVLTAVITGLPGIVIQLILVPLFVLVLQRTEKKHV